MVKPQGETLTLPRNLRGRSIHLNVIPTVCNLKNMIKKLQMVNGDIEQLKQWEKRSYQAYQIQKIKTGLLSSSEIKQKQLIRKHILSEDPNDLGASCIDIYLVAFVAEEYKRGKQAFIDYVVKNGITDKKNTAQAIWQVGKGDGVYLEILNDDGSIRDWGFFSEWIKGSTAGQKVIHNKMVRDRIPEIIKNGGKSPSYRILKHDEYIKELQKKAFEELQEYVEAGNKNEALEELADLLEVIHALAASQSITFEEIEKIRQHKASKKGSFRDRVFLMGVEELGIN